MVRSAGKFKDETDVSKRLNFMLLTINFVKFKLERSFHSDSCNKCPEIFEKFRGNLEPRYPTKGALRFTW